MWHGQSRVSMPYNNWSFNQLTCWIVAFDCTVSTSESCLLFTPSSYTVVVIRYDGFWFSWGLGGRVFIIWFSLKNSAPECDCAVITPIIQRVWLYPDWLHSVFRFRFYWEWISGCLTFGESHFYKGSDFWSWELRNWKVRMWGRLNCHNTNASVVNRWQKQFNRLRGKFELILYHAIVNIIWNLINRNPQV